MNMRLLLTVVSSVVLLSASVSFSGQTEELAKSLTALSEAAAAIDICIERSGKYNLKNDDVLEFYEYKIRISDVADKLSNYYDSPQLYIAYENIRIEMSEDNEVIESVLSEYPRCGNGFMTDIKQYVTEIERDVLR